MNDLVKKVNELLLKGEPGNISVDEHSGYTGYKPQAIIDAMNEVCWGAWGFEEKSSSIETGDKGGLAVAQVQVWLKDIDFRPVGWGQNRVTRGDVGDARKGAQTDAIKKALSYFSIGNRAYHGLLDVKAKSNGHAAAKTEERQPTLDQINRIAQACKLLKRAEPQVETFEQADKLLRELYEEYGKAKKAS